MRVSESLLIKLGQAERTRLERVDGRGIHIHETASRRHLETWTEHATRQRSKHEAAREECLRFGRVAAEQLRATDLHRVRSPVRGKVIGEFKPVRLGEIRQEDVRAEGG